MKDYFRIGDWLLPTVPELSKPNLAVLVDKAIDSDEKVKALIGESSRNGIYLKKHLEECIAGSYRENRLMRGFATVVDVWDKSLVPVSVVADYMAIMGEVGYGISAVKEAAEMAVKLPYMIYYAAKTRNFKTTIGNIGYEALSWFVPGSVLDLTNRYARQADEHIIEKAKEKFLEENNQRL